MPQLFTQVSRFTLSFLFLVGVGQLSASAQAPVVSSLLPARNAVAAPRTSPVSLTFTQAITAASAANLKVYGNQLRGKRPGTLSGGGTATLNFAPTQAFAAGERVSVTVPNTLTNAAGTGTGKQVYQFTAGTGGGGRGFFLDTTEVAYTTTRDQVLGDIDNDGDLDLLTSSGLFGMYSYLNNGTGHFTPYRNTVTGNTPSCATLADVDGDGDLDLLGGDADNPTLAIGLNDGTGLFGFSGLPAQNLIVGTKPVCVTTGDVDADGDLDLVCANYGSNSVSIGFNNGAGLFGGTLNIGVGVQPTSVQLGDVDSDGDLDIVTTSFASNSVVVRLNAGSGAFSVGPTIAVGTAPSDLVLADLDRDGDLDILTSNSGSASVSVRLNNGFGGFAGSTTVQLPAGSTPTGLSAGDVDADGDLDVVVSQGQGGQVITYLNNGLGALTMQYGALELVPSFRGIAVSLGVTLGDLDGDGDLDVVTAEDDSKRVIVGRDGLAPPQAVPTLTGFSPGAGPVGTANIHITGTALASATAVTFNGVLASFVVNSKVELIATVPAGASTGPISVTTVGGTATSAQSFVVTSGAVPRINVLSTTPAANAVSGSPTSVAVTFDAPISSFSTSSLSVVGKQRRGRQLSAVSGGNTSTLTLTASPAFNPGERVSVSIPAALTGTGGGSVRPKVVEYLAATSGTGEGVFGATGVVSSSLAVSTSNLKAVDLDNDGDVDLVGIAAISNSTNTVAVRLNNGTGTFAASTAPLTLSGSASSVLPTDVDGDGDLDLMILVVPTTQPQLRLETWLNNGQGQFTAGAQLSNLNYPQLMQAGDMDADGDQDLVFGETTSTGDNGVRVALNNGAGTFSLQSAVVLAAYFNTLQLADLDNDGDLDVAAAADNQLGSALNDGQGVLTAQPFMATAMGRYRGDMKVGDMTGDGIPDAVLMTSDYNSFGNLPSPLAVFPGLGNGRFGPRGATYLADVNPAALQVADLNADGRLDVLTLTGGTGSAPARIDVLLGNGRGALQLQTNYPVAATGQNISSLEVADFNGDGSLDVVLSNSSIPGLVVRANQGRPAPTITGLSPSVGGVGTRVLITGTNLASTRQVTFGGVATTNVLLISATQCVAVVPAGAVTGPVTATTPGGTATSPGVFTVVVPVPTASISPARNAVGAPTNGNVSVAFAQAQPASAAGDLVVRGDQRQGRRTGVATGAGTVSRAFDPALDFVPGEQVQVTLPRGSATGAFPGLVYDFVAATSGIGTGNLRWSSFLTAEPNSYHNIVGDFDEDGAPDLVTYEFLAGRLRIQFNDGQGRFGARSQVVSTPLVRGMRVADINNDSHLDLVISEFYNYRGNRETNRLVWHAGTGTGAFGAAQPMPIANGIVENMMVGDLNGDGLPDVAACVRTADSVMVCLNTGNGVFQRQPDAVGVVNLKALRLADLDEDGMLDLVTIGQGAQVGIGLGTGAGVFVPSPPINLSSTGVALEVGDVNGDGHVDLVVSTAPNSVQGNILTLLGTGTGTFNAAQTTSTTSTVDYLRLADFDADNDLDLLFCNMFTYSGVQIALNNGAGVFASPLSMAPNVVMRNLALADFNLDGSLDLAMVGDSLASTVKRGLFLYMNRPPAPVLTSFSPAAGPTGTVVTITGSGFSSITRVTIGGVSVAFTIVSNTQITLTTSAAVATGPITVSGLAGSATSTATFTVPVPSVVSFTPASGAVQRVVTLSGQYFGGTTAVRFNGLLAPGFAVAGGTQITVPVPAGATTGPISVTTPSGTGTSTTPFVVVPNPVLVSSAPTRNSNSAPLNAAIALTYSQPINPAVAAAGARLHSTLRGRRSIRVGGGTPLTVGPTADLLPGEELALTIPPGQLDQNGNLVLGPAQVLSFRGATGGTGRGALVANDAPTTLPSQTRRFLAADFTGDNAVDLLAFSNPSSGRTNATLYRNNGQGVFAADPIFGMPSGEYSYIGQADLDEDGDLDLVGTIYVNGSPGWVQPLLNDGQGHFAALPNSGITTSYNPYGQALGDVTGDGHLDLVLRDQTGLRVFPGNGSGDFLPSLPAVTSTQPMDEVRLADLDNDGDLDVLTSAYVSANYYTGVVSVLFNNGQGQFVVPTTPPRYEYGYANINLNDFDNDGDIDLVMQDNYRPGVVFYANDGAGGFGNRVRYVGYPGTATGSDGVAVGDVDADGDLDLLVGTAGASLTVLRNTGNVLFAQPMPVVSTQSAPLAVADFDGDGDLDVLTSNWNVAATSFRLLRNQPAPTPLQVLSHTPAANALNVPRTATVRLNFSQALTVGNFDAWRAFTAQRQGRRRATYSLVGTATPELTPQDALLPGEQVSVSVPALLQAAPTATGAAGARVKPEVFQYTAAVGGTGVGNFGVAPQAPGTFGLNIGPPTDVITADFNDDGVPDILTGGPGPFSNINVTQMYLRLGATNHSGTFSNSSTLIPYAYNVNAHMAAVDFDNDGDLDAAIVDNYGGPLGARLSLANNVGGAFSPNMYWSYDLATGAYAIAFADFDGDGDQDFALTRPQAVDIYLNTRGGFLDQPYTFTHGFAQPVGLAVADLDNNGALDLAVADAATGAVSVWYNANVDAAGISGQVMTLGLGSGAALAANDVKLGDLDGDGDVDLAVLGTTGATGEVRLYRNAGPANSFALAQALPLPNAPSALALADLDHDGDLDLTITAGTVHLRLNAGNLSFGTSANTVAVGGVPGPMALADFDTDGDLDLITLSTSAAAGGLTLRLNGGTVLAARTGTEASSAGLHLYPNPVSSAGQRVQLQAPGWGPQAATVAVYNSLGQLVHQQVLPAASAGTATLTLPPLAAGTYLVRLSGPDRQLSRMLLLE